ncbi:hypothetical protein NITHO_990013 [Nitrolancea hollandica Lb]|uniref:Uncharacterized protein n=1 Tax=Nitrolancea hollandica Lb TaxID=1129897 RepID=I4ENN5_9BACT|nr:hypothetical protein NITHO_990013 [Nitrolancea hollandica Lb]
MVHSRTEEPLGSGGANPQMFAGISVDCLELVPGMRKEGPVHSTLRMEAYRLPRFWMPAVLGSAQWGFFPPAAAMSRL